ncbi:MAG: hypothetical protein QW355_03540 [Sulfolobales archaeon]
MLNLRSMTLITQYIKAPDKNQYLEIKCIERGDVVIKILII